MGLFTWSYPRSHSSERDLEKKTSGKFFKRPHLSISSEVDKRSIERIENVAHNVGVYVWGGYQLFVVLVMLNLLISLMTTTFARIQQNADSEWKFTRYYP